MDSPRRSLSGVFDPRDNGLNFVRLVLASGVIIWHAFPLSGHDIEWAPLRQLLGEVWVDGFFAVSGFLILRSWTRDPHAGRFLRARLLRILPAFWTCLILTAFLIAPVATGVLGLDNVGYVAKNSALWMFQFDIAGTPTGVPYPEVWNGSIWTLAWEFACYLLILMLGILGLLRYRFTLAILFGLCVSATIISSGGLVDKWFFDTAARFGLMFLAGALAWQFRDKIRVNAAWAVTAAIVLMGSLWLPDYRVLAALPLAYLVLVAGILLKGRSFQLRNDISYGVYIYAFPVQQTLAILGFWEAGIIMFASLTAVFTLPFAIASWFFIEKPTLRLRSHRPSSDLDVQLTR